MASFGLEQKKAIISQMPKNGCCRRSLLHGVLAACGDCADGQVTIRLENKEIADAVLSLVREFFGKEGVFLPRKKGERAVSFSFFAPAAARYICEQRSADKVILMPKCKACVAFFLQGIFLSVGRVVAPEKQYCLELLEKNDGNALYNFLLEVGIEMYRRERGKEKILYIRSSGGIEDFFATAQMNAAAFHFMNAKIESDFRNNANRVANCETRNIEKTVAASERHMKAILWLEEQGLLSSLPEELERTARLRLEHSDFSLSLLAASAVPPLSKPGLAHRLDRIVSIANRLNADKTAENNKKRGE